MVREEAGSRVVETWFKAVRLIKWDAQGKIAYLETPNTFVQRWISANYTSLCRTHLGRLLNEETVQLVFCEVGVQAEPALGTPKNGGASTLAVPHNDGGASSNQLFHPAKPLVGTSRVGVPVVHKLAEAGTNKRSELKSRNLLTPHYRFDTFVVGPSNALAFSAAQAVAEKGGKLYNPLFIYGGSGLGKTHLLHAIGNHIREHNRHVTVMYQSTDRFVHDFVQAIRLSKVYDFETRYKDVDILLMDDVQFISNKEQTQEAFFRIFNTMHQEGKQIVFTSDSMPCDIVGLAERMRSRLEGGLIADIQMPALETKIAILHKKAEVSNYVLDDDLAYFIASCECSSIRELEGMLIRVMAYASLVKQPLTVGMARKVLSNVSEQPKEGAAGLLGIARFVGKNFNYTVRDLRSSKRNKDLAQARHVAMFLMKRLTSYSLREIGLFFDRKDHTTVISALDKIAKRIKKDRTFAQEIKHLERDCTVKVRE